MILRSATISEISLDGLATWLRSTGMRYVAMEARTLPGLAFARLVHFGSDLNPDPVVIKTDDDVGQWLDRTLREWGHPKTVVRKLVNGERLEPGERHYLPEIEANLKSEADRLHQELVRRLPSGSTTSVRTPCQLRVESASRSPRV
jgi:hypothetical protein